MVKIRFGPGGLGAVKDAVKNLEMFHSLGIRACEIEFTYGPYIKPSETLEIKKAAEEFDIKLSIHAHYWINLNSEDKQKVEASKKRILTCCKIGEMLGAYQVVFHPGYYGKTSKQETYENIKNAILEIQKEIKKNKWKIKISAETTGKVNVFGSVEEILRLVKETGIDFTIDFAHLLARSNGTMSYKEMVENFKEFKKLHCHFSGIVYGEKGEKHHKLTPEKDLEELLKLLKKTNKEIVIINESPDPLGDSVKSLKIWANLS
jgi:deoxyribonuclease IV